MDAGGSGMLDNAHWVVIAAGFLDKTGIRCHLVSRTAGGFLEHVEILNGEIRYDDRAAVGDILHEAGHIATCPSQVRPHLSGDISDGHRRLSELLDAASGDDNLYQMAINTSDPEATAWAYAAGMHLGIPDDQIIRDQDYDGTGEDIRFGLSLNSYMGINGLHHAGFCVVRNPRYAEIRGLPIYPLLAKWLQD